MNALADAAHAARGGPALQVIAADAAFEEPSRDALAQVMAEKVEALVPVGQGECPRLVRVQTQLQVREDDGDSPLGLDQGLCAKAEHHEVESERRVTIVLSHLKLRLNP